MLNNKELDVLKQPSYEKVANYLRRGILLGKWNYADHLNETALSNELQMSRGPIRDALKLLNHEGLIETQNNGRSIVLGFSRKSFEDWSRVRLNLEKMAVIESLQRPCSSMDKCQALESIVLEMDKFKNNPSERRYHIWLDLKFHLTLVECSHNRTLLKMWKTLSGTLSTILELIADRYDNQEQNNMHKKIVQALFEGDGEKAIHELETHIKEGEKTIQSIVKFLDDEPSLIP